MKIFFKYILAVLLTVTSGSIVFAEEPEDLEFEPIHSSIALGSGSLNFGEVYQKNASLTSNGDAILFKVSKGHSVWSNAVKLPINSMQDYEVNLTFKALSGDGFISISSVGSYSLTFGSKYACLNSEIIKKWKTPQGEVKGQILCKIIRKRNIVTFFLNDKYVGEVNVKPQSQELSLVFAVTSAKSYSVELQSIRLDQGAEDSSDD